MSCGVRDSMALSSALTVEWIMFVFFSWINTIRLSTESSMQRRVMVQGRVWPMRWHRSADCHSAAGFHQLNEVSQKQHDADAKGHSRVNNEDTRCLGQVESHASGFEGHQKALHIDIGHKVLDRRLSLRWRHAAV